MNEKTKILYVDDEKINLILFKHNFSKKYDVHTVLSGFEALDFLDENPDVTLIISDLRMPILDGIEFVTKAKEKHPIKKYFLLSGMEVTPKVQASLDMGLILNYFKKPFDINEILEELEKHTNHSS